MKDGQPQTPSIGAWLAQQFAEGGHRIGVDASIVSSRVWSPLSVALEDSGNQLVAVEGNLVDQIWGDQQPQQTSNGIITLGTEITGKTVADKLADIRREMADAHAEVLVVTALDEVACKLGEDIFFLKHFRYAIFNNFFSGLLNMRGSDIDFNPVFFGYVLVTPSDIHFAVDASKLPADFQQHLKANDVFINVSAYDQIKPLLEKLVNIQNKKTPNPMISKQI